MKLSIFSCLTMLRKAKSLNRLDDLARKERSGWSAGVKGRGSASRRWQICSRNSPRAKLSAKQPWYRPVGGGNGRAYGRQSEPKSRPESGKSNLYLKRELAGSARPEKTLSHETTIGFLLRVYRAVWLIVVERNDGDHSEVQQRRNFFSWSSAHDNRPSAQRV